MLVEVCFKGNRKEFFLWEGDVAPATKAAVIVEADRGEDLGHLHASGELAERRAEKCAHGPGQEPIALKVRRLASPDDVNRLRELREQDESARRKAAERVKANGLAMKLSDAEWRWDRRKLTLYFTAEKRVDFRTLVRELAAMFRTRIELKQIGVRDEAKRLSGIGRCGREYCSASWLPELRPVNLGVAKDQRLSLNPSQISGACGRLMCCLRYEHDFYVQQRKRFPKEGRLVTTAKGQEKVVANDIFRERVTLRSQEGEMRILALEEFKRESGGHRPSEATIEEELAAPSLDEIPEEVIRLQDTVELPAWIPRGGPARPPGGRALPVRDRVPPRNPEPPPLPDESADEAEESTEAAAQDGDANPERRRRRRGRRGGRRNREARHRDHPGDEQETGDEPGEDGTEGAT